MDIPVRVKIEDHAEARKLHIKARALSLGILTHSQIYKAGVEVWRERIDRKSKHLKSPKGE